MPRKPKAQAAPSPEPVVVTLTAEDMAMIPTCHETIVAEARRLAERIAAMGAQVSIAAQVDALNAVRKALHDVSPFRGEPVDLVLWVRAEKVTAYDDYANPNAVAPPELELLRHSMLRNGVGIPLVTHETVDGDEMVDGMHRRKLGTTDPELRARLHGYLPVSRLPIERADLKGRIAATVEYNRARGEHAAERMSDLVRLLYEMGWSDEQIQAELGMQADEVLRLKQITGLAALFVHRDFSKAWEPAR